MRVWRAQPAAFFDEAIIDADGTLVETTGQCKEGMDIAYDGVWGYHPLVVSLANMGEPLYLVNRSGNRPSSEPISARRRTWIGGTRPVCDSSIGYGARANLIREADALPAAAWTRLARRPPYEVQTEPRQRPVNVTEATIVARAFKNLRLTAEAVAEFAYHPIACATPYRLGVVRKNISVEQGEQRLFDEIRYFFHLTNDDEPDAAEVVFLANDRCNQENLSD